MEYLNFFLDTEFIENGGGQPIELLSIGLVCQDGRAYYAENSAADLSKANPWVVENVLPYLTGDRKTPEQIRSDLISFVGNPYKAAGIKPRFWGYFADYDWVLFCQLFGRMVDLPDGFPFFCWDLKQRMEELGVKKAECPAQVGKEHNALSDALWNLDLFRFLEAKRNA